MKRVVDFETYETLGKKIDTLFEHYKNEQRFYNGVENMLKPQFTDYITLEDEWTEQVGDIIISSIDRRK